MDENYSRDRLTSRTIIANRIRALHVGKDGAGRTQDSGTADLDGAHPDDLGEVPERVKGRRRRRGVLCICVAVVGGETVDLAIVPLVGYGFVDVQGAVESKCAGAVGGEVLAVAAAVDSAVGRGMLVFCW